MIIETELGAVLNAASNLTDVINIYDRERIKIKEHTKLVSPLLNRDVAGEDYDVEVKTLLWNLGIEDAKANKEVVRIDVFAEILKHDADLKQYLNERVGKSKMLAQIQLKKLIGNEKFVEDALDFI